MSEEPETIQPKGEALVKHCPICGVEYGRFLSGISYHSERSRSCYIATKYGRYSIVQHLIISLYKHARNRRFVQDKRHQSVFGSQAHEIFK